MTILVVVKKECVQFVTEGISRRVKRLGVIDVVLDPVRRWAKAR